MTESALVADFDAIPEALTETPQWFCWEAEERDGKTTKIPRTVGTWAYASTTDDRTWTTYAEAVHAAALRDVGLGFVFTDDDPLVGVDLDGCRDPETGDLEDDAADIVDRLDSYTEVSPSGTGVHVIARGTLPDGRNRHEWVEMYETARYFTVTGDHVAGTPREVCERRDAIRAVHREYVAEDTPETPDQPSATASGGTDLSDEALIERARNAANGEKFARLWRGSTSGYDSHSEADMALCCLLAFWTNRDAHRVDQLFRQSGLMRPKWDERHFADGSTYGEKTVERAVNATSEGYEPDTEVVSYGSERRTPEMSMEQRELAERNRLLREEITKLHDRIEELEAQLEGTQPNRETQPAVDDLPDTVEASGDDAGQTGVLASVWRRLVRSR